MRLTPIPNDDERCQCFLGKSDSDDIFSLIGQGDVHISIYRNCPLHGDYARMIAKSALKGLSICQ